jgi:hypothetical protein
MWPAPPRCYLALELTRCIQNATICERIANWTSSISFLLPSNEPPEFGEEQTMPGPNRATRGVLSRAFFTLSVGESSQVVDTVCHSWLVPQVILPRSRHETVHVHLYVPLELYGTISPYTYRNGLRHAVAAIFDPSAGPLHRQPFMLGYVSTRISYNCAASDSRSSFGVVSEMSKRSSPECL